AERVVTGEAVEAEVDAVGIQAGVGVERVGGTQVRGGGPVARQPKPGAVPGHHARDVSPRATGRVAATVSSWRPCNGRRSTPAAAAVWTTSAARRVSSSAVPAVTTTRPTYVNSV